MTNVARHDFDGGNHAISGLKRGAIQSDKDGFLVQAQSARFGNAVTDDYRDSLSDTTAPFGRLSPGTSLTGSIEVSGDRDIFSISLTAGQTYTFNLRGGTGVDAFLRLLNSSGSQLASNDDFGGTLNSQISFRPTTSGTYYLEARDYGSGRGTYTISSTGNPPTVTDDFRDSLTDTTAPVGTLTIGTPRTGRIETGGDIDLFSVTLTAGQSYTFSLNAASSGGLSDPFLRLLNNAGTQLASNDDFGGGRNSQISFTATTSGIYHLEAKGYSASLTGSYSVNAVATTAPPPTSGGFDIRISYSGDAQYQAAFEQAAQRWESVITGDLPDFTSQTFGLIDDLLINASAIAIDGAGGVLGRAGPDEVRSGSLIPAHGIMEFDSADLAGMAANGTLVGVIMHEMGHVLGLGTLWDDLGLKSDEYSYIGQNALAEYRTLSGNAGATFIPLERTGGAGTAGGHWAEDVFGIELMTGYANGSLPMSRMTIASLKDMGYVVDYSRADPYTLASSNVAALQLAPVDNDYFGII